MSACFIIPWGCAGKKQPQETDMQNTTIRVSLDSGFQLMHNQAAVIEPEDLSVKFVNVAEDSRCPVGVECIWAGQAKIELEIRLQGNKPYSITLISQEGRDDLAIKRLNGLFVKLVKVEPRRQPNQELSLKDYLITLNISRSINLNY